MLSEPKGITHERIRRGEEDNEQSPSRRAKSNVPTAEAPQSFRQARGFLSLPWLLLVCLLGFLPWSDVSSNSRGLTARKTQSGYQSLYGGVSSPVALEELAKNRSQKTAEDYRTLAKQADLEESDFLLSFSPFLACFWAGVLATGIIICLVPLSSVRLKFILPVVVIMLAMFVLLCVLDTPLERRINRAIAEEVKQDPTQAYVLASAISTGKTIWFWFSLAAVALAGMSEVLTNLVWRRGHERVSYTMPCVAAGLFVGLSLIGVSTQVAVRELGLDAMKSRIARLQKAEEEKAPKTDTSTEMTLAAFLAQRPAEPAKITADCKLSNYYNCAYRDTAATHHSVAISSSRASGHAWVPKNSEEGKRIFEALKDGQEHRLTVQVVLQGPDGTATPLEREEMAIVSDKGTPKAAEKPRAAEKRRLVAEDRSGASAPSDSGTPPARDASREFSIVQAKYGTGNDWADVTEQIRKMVKDSRLRFLLPREGGELPTLGFPDPAPNRLKHLVLVYAYNGKENTVTVETGQQIELPPDAPPATNRLTQPRGMQQRMGGGMRGRGDQGKVVFYSSMNVIYQIGDVGTFPKSNPVAARYRLAELSREMIGHTCLCGQVRKDGSIVCTVREISLVSGRGLGINYSRAFVVKGIDTKNLKARSVWDPGETEFKVIGTENKKDGTLMLVFEPAQFKK
jgi:hypothetical protein